ncbi:hypothetical protein [Pseudodesulfovibrio indicus]|uniref:hypothetical protein n=1 Tax=Pseudodesulfovibrio indicus TaxID=1716143 RepID=UPI00292E86E0|nr:hypothetical protein [Pseudodesulfovibrio indicus]
MAVRELDARPEAMGSFPDDGTYRWLELGDTNGPYGVAAIAPRAEYLELHLTVTRWGPGVRRGVARDLEWVKDEARRLGLPKIMGVRADGEGRFDPNLFRFARLFGFTETCVFQTASMNVN